MPEQILPADLLDSFGPGGDWDAEEQTPYEPPNLHADQPLTIKPTAAAR